MLFQTKRKIEEKHHVLAALQLNGYPKQFIQRTVKKHNRRKEQPRERSEEEPKQTKSINLPYIQGVSEQLKRAQLKRALDKHNIKVTIYTHTTLRSLLSKPRDSIPKEDRNIRKCWALRKTGNKNHQGGNLLRRKRASYQWNILQVTKYFETKLGESKTK